MMLRAVCKWFARLPGKAARTIVALFHAGCRVCGVAGSTFCLPAAPVRVGRITVSMLASQAGGAGSTPVRRSKGRNRFPPVRSWLLPLAGFRGLAGGIRSGMWLAADKQTVRHAPHVRARCIASISSAVS